MDRLASVLEKLAEGDRLDKAIGVLEYAASKLCRWQVVPVLMPVEMIMKPHHVRYIYNSKAILMLRDLQLFRASLIWCLIINGNKVKIDLESQSLHQLPQVGSNQVPGLHSDQIIFQYI